MSFPEARLFRTLPFLFLIMGFQVMAQSRVAFDARTVYLGSVKPGSGPFELSFVFTNKGDAELQVSGVETTQGCRILGTSRGLIKPGARGFISLLYSPPASPGRFMQAIPVYFDGVLKERYELVVTGEVLPREKTPADDFPFLVGDLRLKTGSLDLCRFRNNEKVTREFRVFNAGKSPMKWRIDPARPHMDAWITPQSLDPGMEAVLTVVYNASRKGGFGPLSDTLRLYSEAEGIEPLEIMLKAYLDEDFSRLKPDQLAEAPKVSFTNTSHDFGAVQTDSEVSHTFEIRNKGKRQLLVRKVVSSSPYLSYELENTRIRFHQAVKLKVLYSAVDKPGPFMEQLTLICNDPDRPEVNVYVQGAVVK
ncbi:MAG: DUF1573 domain-containing protein [Bacteroidales bacterium]|nr:DUF1573 domain-containing protein [Bacteroidales bacterium]